MQVIPTYKLNKTRNAGDVQTRIYEKEDRSSEIERVAEMIKLRLGQGCQMVFSDQKSQFGKKLSGPQIGKC
jgi:hypothetical protein